MFPPSPKPGPRIILSRVGRPGGECIAPQHPEAEVLNTHGNWMPVTVLAWHKLEKPFRQRITFITIRWLVQLRQDDGSEGWFVYTGSCMRPVNEGSSGSSSDNAK